MSMELKLRVSIIQAELRRLAEATGDEQPRAAAVLRRAATLLNLLRG